MLGQRMKELRETRGLRQEDLAKVAGVTPEAIGMYENEKREPKGEILLKLAAYLGTTSDYLLGLSDIPYSSERQGLDYEQRLHQLGAFLKSEGATDEDVRTILDLLRQRKKLQQLTKQPRSQEDHGPIANG